MTIKERFRKALFAFFSKEIMELTKPIADKFAKRIVDYDRYDVEVKELAVVIDLDNLVDMRGRPPLPSEIKYLLSQEIRRQEKVLFDEVRKLIFVDERMLFDVRDPKVKVSVFVGQLKKRL